MTFEHEPDRPTATWILVADRARARVFSGEWPGLEEFREIRDFAHPEGAAHKRDVASDGPGRCYESRGPRHAVEPPTDFKHRTATEFAREIVRELQAGKDENAYGRVEIIAPALLLGVLRNQLPGPLSRMVVADLDEDLTLAAADSIREGVGTLISTTSESC